MDEPKDATSSAVRVGDLLDEICHKLCHLHRSQEELTHYLAEEPEDSDIRDAIAENDLNMDMLCRKINILKSELPDTDPRTQRDLSVICSQEWRALLSNTARNLTEDRLGETCPGDSNHHKSTESDPGNKVGGVYL